jgi:hypothetical protein
MFNSNTYDLMYSKSPKNDSFWVGELVIDSLIQFKHFCACPKPAVIYHCLFCVKLFEVKDRWCW